MRVTIHDKLGVRQPPHPAQLVLVCATLTQNLWVEMSIPAAGDACPCHLLLRALVYIECITSEPTPSWAVSTCPCKSSLCLAGFSSSYRQHPFSIAPPRVPCCGDLGSGCNQSDHILLVRSQTSPAGLAARMQGLHTHKNWFELFPQFSSGTSRFIPPAAEVFGIPLIAERELHSQAGDVI